MVIDLVVTRHPALLEYLQQEGLVGDCEVVTHATAEMVEGKNVLGVLPHSLSCLCSSFTEVPMVLPLKLRGCELTVTQVRAYAKTPVTYKVSANG